MKLKTEFTFDAAHRLVGYTGLCSRIHGHQWLVEIEIKGEKLDDIGILWDFTNTKKLKEMFDHKTILKDCSANCKLIDVISEVCGVNSLYRMQENPTAENLANLILGTLRNTNPLHLQFKVNVWESPKSSCEVGYEN